MNTTHTDVDHRDKDEIISMLEARVEALKKENGLLKLRLGRMDELLDQTQAQVADTIKLIESMNKQ